MPGMKWRLVLFGMILIAACNPQEEKKPEKIIRPVRYSEVKAQDAHFMRTFSGVAKAVVESKMSFKVAGTIQKINVKVGDRMKKGDLIARLDPTDYEIKLQEAEASLARARAEARNAAANYKRIRALYENRNVSRNELDAARAAAESTEAAVRSIEKQMELAERQIDYTRLTAPADCAVAAVPVEVNENVQPGYPIATLACGSQIEVHVAVPESIINQIEEEDEAVVKFDAIDGKEFPAVVTEVGVSAVALETTFPVIVRLKSSDERMRPGMAAEVSFKLEENAAIERMVIPAVAVAEDREGTFVFVVEPKSDGRGIVHRRSVEIGEITPEGIEIKKGLISGDRIVTAGVSRIRDGLEVKLPPLKGKTN